MAKGKIYSRGAILDQPEGKIRRSQVVTTFGPGAMIDLVDQAVVVGGLDFWDYSAAPTVLQEERLRESLAQRFQDAGRRLSVDNPFRQPPVGDDKDPTRRAGIQVLELPRWFVCQNPACRALVRSDGLELKGDRYLHECSRFHKEKCVPVRFVAACKRGHVQDFPWRYFAHRNGGQCDNPSLQLVEGATGDFFEIVVECRACGARERLSAAMAQGAMPGCEGERPWLGAGGVEGCKEGLRLLVRSASNAYFSQVVSAISIPEPGRELAAKIKSQWDILKGATAATLPAFRTIETVREALEGYGDEEVLAVVEAFRMNVPAVTEPLRTAEFRQLVSQGPEQPGDLPLREDSFFARRAVDPEGGLPPEVAGVVLVRKLREVRVEVGFTRIEPVTPNLQGEFDLGVQSAALGLATDWLPASEVKGEGFFLLLDEGAMREWEQRDAVRRREAELAEGYQSWTSTLKGQLPLDFPGSRFYLLHSLAHLLISAVSLEAGYSASAIRERIYCAPAGAAVPMAGILLYTGSTGTEGTLGGLVEQGRRVRSHLRAAWELGVLCSNDPVCAAHSPKGDHSERFLEGAACHGCLYIAESSCERFNRYLDRALVVPAIGHEAGLAFFTARP